ncbi:complement receptor type 1-like [Branchiostoma lanceolatum]|uniref:complement receptor type 1-like n=1 Tax=Branchiostoma lanceolatum TaxID=7740 RepID=UPI00345360CF
MKAAIRLVSAILAANLFLAVAQIPDPLPNTCSSPVDLVFLVDSSESFRTSGFQDALTFVQQVVNYFTLGEDETRVGVVTFSNEDAQITRIKLNERYNRVDLLTAIRAIPYDRGHTFTGLGLDHVRNNSFLEVNGRRSNTPDFLVVLTDDHSEDDVTRPAQLIRDMGITVFVVGVGEERDIDQATLENIAGTPSRVFRLTDHDNLVDDASPRSIRESICNAARCPELTAPINGARIPATGSHSVQNVISFTCNTGYVLNGASSVTCQADLTWTALVPTCAPVQCPARTAPANGAVSSTAIGGYQNVVTFTCDQCYNLAGSTSITCQANGVWSANPPTCNRVQCPRLGAPTNGARTPSTEARNCQDVVTFTCDQCYSLAGSTSATCQTNGLWSANLPTCNRVQCPRLGSPTNGARTPPTEVRNCQDVVTFTCDQCYNLAGATSATCQANGQWSAILPTCNRVQCRPLGALTNGARTPSTEARNCQDVVTFTCDQCYNLAGSTSATCQANGLWSANLPTCNRVQCPPLSAPTNGARTPSTGARNCQDVVTFTCNTGYVLNEAASVTCQADTTWTAPVPTCTRGQCPPLAAPANGARTPPTGATSFQSVVTFTCNQCYNLAGSTSRTCQTNGQWSANQPTCNRVQCPPLGALTNGARTPSTEARNCQDVVTFTCDQCYNLAGSTSATCQANGQWSANLPTCNRVQCPPLGAPTNGARTPSTEARNCQDVVTFTCDQCYNLAGSTSATCQANGLWSANLPTCNRVQCPPLSAPTNGARTPSTGARNCQDVVTFTCNTGYVLNGATSVTCQADTTWTAPVPTCTRGQCPPLAAPANGARTPPTGATSFQSVVTFTCNQCYNLAGSTSRTCQTNGQWSENQPTCNRVQCPPLGALTNGARTPSTEARNCQDVVTFTCDQCYNLAGSTSATCQANGQWSAILPTCNRVQCPPLGALTNGARTPSIEARNCQDVVTFTCDQCYNLAGSTSATCQTNGLWSANLPTCNRVQCPSLTAPTNGARTPSTGARNCQDVVSFTCNTGYVLNGAASVTCQADTRWTAPVPTCTRRQCPPLAAPANGARTPLTGANSFQSVVTFTCNQCYNLAGPTSRTCQTNGQWSANQPTCNRVQCPRLGAPTNGARTPSTEARNCQDVVTFTCDQCYNLAGSTSATCQTNGLWSANLPTCNRVQCPPLGAPTNGARTPPTGARNCQDVVSFTCNTGYVLNGAASVTCQADTTWTAPVPTCTRGECPPLAAPANGARTPPTGATSFQSVVTFTCNQCYNLAGSISRTCQTNGQWSANQPTCNRVQCPPLGALTNGARTPSTEARNCQDVVTFTCDQCYNLAGSTSATCQANGQWSANLPTCNRVQCPLLSAPTNGARTPSTGARNCQDVVSFTCNTGYVLNGAASVTCQADTRWTAPVPTCTRRQCPPLAAPANGARTPPTGATSFQSVVTFTCNQCYNLAGSTSRTCQTNGQWSANQPTCNRVQCPPLGALTNGARTPSTEARNCQDVVTFTCDQCYNLAGSTSATCQANGLWSANLPTCNRVQCPPLGALTNGARTPSTEARNCQDVVTFTCDQCYNLAGSTSATCQTNGQWSANLPTCNRVQCPPLGAPTNGARTPSTGARNCQDVVSFTCNTGYVLNGAASVTCQADTTWTRPVPTCTPVQCQGLTAPANGALSTTARTYQTQVTTTCNAGYTLNGVATTTCQANMAWSNAVPTCTPRPCPTLTAPTNGALSPLGPHAYPTTVTFTCNSGYARNGAETTTCQTDGRWSNPRPTCTPGQCPELTAPTNGARTPPTGATSFQSVVTFTCNTGYVMNGAASVTCQADTTWTAPVPTCAPVQCPALTALAFGSRSTEATSYQTVVTFTCNTGYTLNGNANTRCQADRTWTNAVPACTPVQCPARTAPANGAVSSTAIGRYQDVVTFTCNQCYNLAGSTSITCQANGEWSANQQTCNRVQCPRLAAPTNGARTPSTEARNCQDVVTFTCNTGYELDGASSVTCQANQQWSAPIPTCRPVQCPELTAPPFGSLSPVGATSYQDVVNFNCNPGYTLNGATSATCQANRAWSNAVPTCTPVQCPMVVAPANGARTPPTGARNYQNVVTFTCDPGYVLNGAASVTCQANQQWSRPIPTCTIRQCPMLTAPANGARTPPTGARNYQDMVTFTCNPGYTRNGAEVLTCQAGGQWSNPRPTCNPVQCPALTAPAFGSLRPTGVTSYPNRVMFTCDTEYDLNGASETQCQAGGTWSNPVPTCTPESCARLDSDGWDIVFLMDSTRSVDYARVKSVTRDIADRLLTDGSNTRVGLVQFSDNPTATFDLNTYNTKSAIINAIEGANQLGGGTFAGGALTYVSQVSFATANGGRPNRPDALIVVTDGLSFDDVTFASQSVREEGITTFAVGAGDEVDSQPLRAMAADPYKVRLVTNDTQHTAAVQAIWRWFCLADVCSDPGNPTNGFRRGTIYQGEKMFFSCHDTYLLDGPSPLTCNGNFRSAAGTWSGAVPTCRLGDACIPNPCLNGGRCFPTASGYRCVCAAGFVGRDCGFRPATIIPGLSTSAGGAITNRLNGPGWDLVYLLDSSGSVGSSDFQRVRDVTKNIIGQLPLRNMNTRIGLAQYSDRTQNVELLKDYQGKDKIIERIENISPLGGGTLLGNAISDVRTVSFTEENGNRPNVPDALVVVTDGNSADDVVAATDAARRQGIHVFAVGVGDNVDRNKVNQIAGKPERVFLAPTPAAALTSGTNMANVLNTATECSNPGQIPNGLSRGTTFVTGQMDFSCDDGYALVGQSSLTCVQDGQNARWSGPVPVCRIPADQCPALTAPANGARTPATGANSYQDRVMFTCDSGYVRNGASNTTCQSDGTWSNDVPTCTAEGAGGQPPWLVPLIAGLAGLAALALLTLLLYKFCGPAAAAAPPPLLSAGPAPMFAEEPFKEMEEQVAVIDFVPSK